MRKPSNPCKWFGNGGSYTDQELFTYEGGKHLYYFAPGKEIDKKVFDHWIPLSLVFFADDVNHAKDVIERMLKFRIDVNKRHDDYLGHSDYSRSTGGVNLPQILLDNKDKWIIDLAPINQFYTVGWADNDTIL